MKKQVPEKLGSIELVEQECRLKELALNAHFNRLRKHGLGGNFIPTMKRCLKDETGVLKAPSRVAEDVKFFTSSLPVVFSKLAQLKRDDCLWAAREVEKALSNPNYRFVFEHENNADTVPITLIMFEAELALYFVNKDRINRWEDGFEGGAPNDRELISLEDAPSNLSHLGGTWGFNKPYTFGCVVAQFIEKLSEPHLATLEKFGKKYQDSRRKDFNRGSIVPDDRQKKSVSGFPIVCAFIAEQKDILREISRSVQKRLASWHLKLPKTAVENGLENLSIGLFPESEHAFWKMRRELFCSSSVSFSYGVIAFPGEAYNQFNDSQKENIDRRILLF